jgi:hypothetical protein
MCWFQPLSSEPLGTYQLLGALMALAIYNGIPAPLPLPFAFYHLLFHSSTRDGLFLIKDGWPTLHKNLSGDLDSLGLDWTFTFEANGTKYSCDMSKSPAKLFPLSEPFVETPMVVSVENQEEYRHRYVYWLLMGSVYPQLASFAKGFLSVLPLNAIKLLTPGLLCDLGTGTEIDFEALKDHTTYQGDYSEDHQTIKWFWEILQEMTIEERRKFQLFVFANDRVSMTTLSNYWLTITRPMDNSEEVCKD